MTTPDTAYSLTAILEQADDYDLVGYLEDDLLMSDPEFFAKIFYLDQMQRQKYVFLPHRCEHIPGRGDVILSGDPDGGDLIFSGTPVKRSIFHGLWGNRRFYRATNPHSGCYFLSRTPSTHRSRFLGSKNWQPDWNLSGPARAGRERNVATRDADDETCSRALPLSHGAPSRHLWERHDLKNQRLPPPADGRPPTA